MLLAQIWLNDDADPSDRIAIGYVGDGWEAAPSIPGQVREYAGNLRAVTTGVKRTPLQVPVEFHTDRVLYAWLESHLGRTLWLRDPRGRKVAGIIWELPTRETSLPEGRLSATSITFHPLTVRQPELIGEAGPA